MSRFSLYSLESGDEYFGDVAAEYFSVPAMEATPSGAAPSVTGSGLSLPPSLGATPYRGRLRLSAKALTFEADDVEALPLVTFRFRDLCRPPHGGTGGESGLQFLSQMPAAASAFEPAPTVLPLSSLSRAPPPRPAPRATTTSRGPNGSAANSNQASETDDADLTSSGSGSISLQASQEPERPTTSPAAAVSASKSGFSFSGFFSKIKDVITDAPVRPSAPVANGATGGARTAQEEGNATRGPSTVSTKEASPPLHRDPNNAAKALPPVASPQTAPPKARPKVEVVDPNATFAFRCSQVVLQMTRGTPHSWVVAPANNASGPNAPLWHAFRLLFTQAPRRFLGQVNMLLSLEKEATGPNPPGASRDRSTANDRYQRIQGLRKGVYSALRDEFLRDHPFSVTSFRSPADERMQATFYGSRVLPMASERCRVILSDRCCYIQSIHGLVFTQVGGSGAVKCQGPLLSFPMECLLRVTPTYIGTQRRGVEWLIALNTANAAQQEAAGTIELLVAMDTEEDRQALCRALNGHPRTRWNCRSGLSSADRRLTSGPRHSLTTSLVVMKWQAAWSEGTLSNFDYLMALNAAAGRSHNDASQYPILPWVISNFTDATLDLSNPKNFRDLSKPVGALNAERLQRFKNRVKDVQSLGDPLQPLYLYATHYSNPAYVTYFLVREHPEYMLVLQGGRVDHGNRLFESVAESWHSALNGPADVKELIPEFYLGSGRFLLPGPMELGVKEVGSATVPVSPAVILPPWAQGDPMKFIRMHRDALESEIVSAHLHLWIDLIFGCRQRGDAAWKAENVFHPGFYRPQDAIVPGRAGDDDDRIQTPTTAAAKKGSDDFGGEDDESAVESRLKEFGCVPRQLFAEPHPRRAHKGPTPPSAVDYHRMLLDGVQLEADAADVAEPVPPPRPEEHLSVSFALPEMQPLSQLSEPKAPATPQGSGAPPATKSSHRTRSVSQVRHQALLQECQRWRQLVEAERQGGLSIQLAYEDVIPVSRATGDVLMPMSIRGSGLGARAPCSALTHLCFTVVVSSNVTFILRDVSTPAFSTLWAADAAGQLHVVDFKDKRVARTLMTDKDTSGMAASTRRSHAAFDDLEDDEDDEDDEGSPGSRRRGRGSFGEIESLPASPVAALFVAETPAVGGEQHDDATHRTNYYLAMVSAAGAVSVIDTHTARIDASTRDLGLPSAAGVVSVTQPVTLEPQVVAVGLGCSDGFLRSVAVSSAPTDGTTSRSTYHILTTPLASSSQRRTGALIGVAECESSCPLLVAAPSENGDGMTLDAFTEELAHFPTAVLLTEGASARSTRVLKCEARCGPQSVAHSPVNDAVEQLCADDEKAMAAPGIMTPSARSERAVRYACRLVHRYVMLGIHERIVELLTPTGQPPKAAATEATYAIPSPHTEGKRIPVRISVAWMPAGTRRIVGCLGSAAGANTGTIVTGSSLRVQVSLMDDVHGAMLALEVQGLNCFIFSTADGVVTAAVSLAPRSTRDDRGAVLVRDAPDDDAVQLYAAALRGVEPPKAAAPGSVADVSCLTWLPNAISAPAGAGTSRSSFFVTFVTAGWSIGIRRVDVLRAVNGDGIGSICGVAVASALTDDVEIRTHVEGSAVPSSVTMELDPVNAMAIGDTSGRVHLVRVLSF